MWNLLVFCGFQFIQIVNLLNKVIYPSHSVGQSALLCDPLIIRHWDGPCVDACSRFCVAKELCAPMTLERQLSSCPCLQARGGRALRPAACTSRRTLHKICLRFSKRPFRQYLLFTKTNFCYIFRAKMFSCAYLHCPHNGFSMYKCNW